MTPTEQSYLLIPLSQGQFAKVSPHRFANLSRWKWHAYWNENAKTFYAVRKLPRETGKPRMQVWMHREILGLPYQDSRQGDHHNHDGLDNRDFNLRIANRFQQQANTHAQRNNKSGHKGVSWSSWRGKWKSQIMHNGKQVILGYFPESELEAAADAYRQAAVRLKGEFACF